MAIKTSKIYRVHFNNPTLIEGQKNYFFGSLAAIFEVFTSEELEGITLRKLWKAKISKGNYLCAPNVSVWREDLYHKKAKCKS